jgi:hypothetical protein
MQLKKKNTFPAATAIIAITNTVNHIRRIKGKLGPKQIVLLKDVDFSLFFCLCKRSIILD